MKYLLIILAVLVLGTGAMAEQISFGIDRCVVLNSVNHQDTNSKVAIHFNLPPELRGRDVVFAELSFSLPAMRLSADSLLLIRFYPLLADWSENNLNYDGSQAITDSLTAGVNTAQLADSNLFSFDLTFFIKDIVDGHRDNFGLIALTSLLGNDFVRLPEGIRQRLVNGLRIKVVYQ